MDDVTHHRVRLAAAIARALLLGVPAAVVVLLLDRLAPDHPVTGWCRREADGVWRAWCRWRWLRVAEGAGLVTRDRLADEVLAPRLTRLQPTSAGAVATLRLTPGQHVGQVDAAAPAIRAGMRCERVEVTEDRPGRCAVVMVRSGRDPLARPQPWPWAPTECSWDVDGLPFAVDSSGAPVRLSVGLHTLIGGLSGAGKSGALGAILAGLAPLPVAVVGIDPKGTELTAWAPRCSLLGVPGGNGPAGGRRQASPLEVLDAMTRLQADRFALLADTRRTMWDPDLGPWVVVVVDELAAVVATGVRSDDAAATVALRSVAQMGRAAGIWLVVATQRPAADTVPTALRDLMQRRIAFATSTSDHTETILGAGLHRAGPAHEIPLDRPGVAWIGTDGSRRPTLARVMHVDPVHAAAIAAATADLAPAVHLPVGVP